MKTKVFLFGFVLCFFNSFSQTNLWQKTNLKTNSEVKEAHLNSKSSQLFSLNSIQFLELAKKAPKRQFNSVSEVIVSIPNEQGQIERFRIFEASNMDPELQEKYPEILSYEGQGIDDPSAVLRFSISPYGFNAMVMAVDKPTYFIEPYTKNLDAYVVYNRAEKFNTKDPFECSVVNKVTKAMDGDGAMQRNADDSVLRTYRLAVSTTGEYTQYHGGTKAQALAAINTTMTRVNGIFEVDFNVNMVLVANTDDVIYTSAGSDPYGSSGLWNSQLQSTLTSNIGEANYDVGHLFAQGQNNGNAGCIGCVCVDNQKGRGWTNGSIPEGDLFDVDYVAHELGHQFGANHTWTFGGNEGTNVQVEPGSGTTIMSYAGITGSNTDVEQNVTDNFHAVSIEQVTDYIKTTSCQTNTNTGNSVPTVNAGSDYTIPRGTAFILDGTASDADAGDVLSYVWEQMDENNAASTIPSVNATSGVAFRAYAPTSDSFRYFPRLETIKAGSTSWKWEAVPNVSRDLNFRLTVRDNVVGGGTNNSDDMVVSVTASAGPFVVNSPNTNVTWDAGTIQTVTWNVAGTTGNGVNAANVDIFLSIDGGDTYPITLASGVPNDGSHDIIIPNNQGTQNRIMVRGSNNIFFDISNSNFTIGAPIICNADVPTGLTASNVAATTTTLSWDAVSGATYDLRYREVGSSTWTTVAVTGISTNLTGLTTLTDYEAQVRSKCSGGSTSAYSNSVNFTTTDECSPTTSNFNSNTLNHSGTGSTGTTLNFTGGTHEDVSFTVTELNARTGGRQNRRFIDRVVITYTDGNGATQNFGTFTGNSTSSVNVSITGFVQSVTVALSDAFDGNAGTNMSVTLSAVASCVTSDSNCTDSDGDGVCDEDDACPDFDDNLIGTSCDDGDDCTINDVYGSDCNCAGTFADSDGDGVCDADDICPGGDDNVDLDGNGTPDACDSNDNCTNNSASFNPSSLNGASSVSYTFANPSKDVTFTISGLNARVNGNPRNRFEEVATVTYVDANGQTQTFNSYSGANQSSANVTITEFINQVTVTLSNGVSGSNASIGISLSTIDFCEQNSGATIKNNNSTIKIKDFAVFPNPAKTELNIRLGLEIENSDAIDITLKVYDLRGRVVKAQNWTSISSSFFEKQLNISELNKGVYMFVLESSKGIKKIQKLIKN